jgi:anti-sigma regulatory factor (Ser/Thr protein kinase)/ketosteroid isomerase-like protein
VPVYRRSRFRAGACVSSKDGWLWLGSKTRCPTATHRATTASVAFLIGGHEESPFRSGESHERRGGIGPERVTSAHSSNVLALHPQALAVLPGPRGLSEGRGFIDRTLSEVGLDAATRYQITVAANEAVSNAMEHGAPCGDGHFHLTAMVKCGSFVFSVRDCGEFEQAASPAPDPVAERGRGFAFMNLLMDDVRLDTRPGGTVLRLAKRLPGTPLPPRDADPAAAEHNRRVVQDLFDAFAARDVARTVELVDRGVMIEPLSTPVERRSPYLGVGGLRRYLRDLDETWDEFDVTIGGIRADGNYVVAVGRIYARQGRLVADDPVAFVFKLRDAKVVWAKVYRSEAEALAAAGWA